MDCRVCHGRKSRFLCVSCVSEIVLRHDKLTRKQNSQLAQVAAAALKSLDRDLRSLCARKEFLESELCRLNTSVQQHKETLQKNRLSASERRTRLAHRRQNLAAAQKKFINAEQQQQHTKSFIPFVNISPSSSPLSQLDVARQRLSSFRANADSVYQSIAKLRRLYVTELMDIFCISRSPSTSILPPSLPSLPSQPSQPSSYPDPLYSVVSAVLSSPTNPQQYSPAQLDYAVAHLAHCVRLIAMYLGVKLPFTIFTGPRPSIRATRDSPWADRWSTKHSLCLLSSFDSNEDNDANSGNSAIHALTQTKSFSGLASIAIGQYHDRVDNNINAKHFQQFITGLLMLAYDVSYIVHTQSPHHPASSLVRVPNIIANLRALVEDITGADSAFGRRSHTTVFKLPALEVALGNHSGNSSNNTTAANVATNERRKSAASVLSVDENSHDLRLLTWNEVGFDRVLANALGTKALWSKQEANNTKKTTSAEEDWDVIDGQDLLSPRKKEYSSSTRPAPQQQS